MNEIWKPIKETEGMYEISNLGRVKSVSRFHKTKDTGYYSKEKILKTSKDTCGYLHVSIYIGGKIMQNEEIKEEIDEILDLLKDETKDTRNIQVITRYEINQLLNYITNLQEENKRLKGNLMYMKSLKAIAEEKRRTPEDYFVDMQNENERLKEENQKLVKVIDELEKWLIKGIKNYSLNDFYRLGLEKTFNKLTELKGGNNDEI